MDEILTLSTVRMSAISGRGRVTVDLTIRMSAISGRGWVTVDCRWTTYRHCPQYVCQQLVDEVESQWTVDGRDRVTVHRTYVSKKWTK